MDEWLKYHNVTFPIRGNRHDMDRKLDEILFGYESYLFSNIFSNSFDNFIERDIEELYQTDQMFIYPIIMFDNRPMDLNKTMDFDSRLVDRIHNKKARICITQAYEGYLGEELSNYKWISRLAKKYNFEKDDILVITSNLLMEDKYNEYVELGKIDDNFTVISYPYFQRDLWFVEDGKGILLNPTTGEYNREKMNGYLETNRSIKKDLHFLCFNRLPKPHRLLIFSELKTNPNFEGKSITTMGRSVQPDVSNFFYKDIKGQIKETYKHGHLRILKYLRDYDESKDTVYDQPDLDENQAANLNVEAHSRTFVNLVTETLISENSIFFSEKIYKPIYMLQPFILIGNPNSLKKLKELGFRTFDKWWDESYDQEMDLTSRLEKIVDIMLEISSWDMDKCFRITQEMEEVLVHNSENLLKHDLSINTFKKILQ